MSVNALTLPVDIPWKRLCVSEDMIDPQVCDRTFPLRWLSSMAVFGYQPPDADQTYDGMTVSYLKVAVTITGFQSDLKEVGLDPKDRRVDSHWNTEPPIQNYKDTVGQYYGCYGAILEVAIGPRSVPDTGDVDHPGPAPDVSQYPYFADFEPKKRELYEMVTDSGETMSRSLEDVNVRKGTTTTTNHENVDILTGLSHGASFQYAGAGGSFQQAIQGQFGTRDLSGAEYANVRTSDQARELRETASHTTQLTQMYHQFTGYHIGTNRAVFFMLPRPHIVQSDLTFVNGPRLLEGIQEVFLVVLRPNSGPDFCVEAYLETAHIGTDAVYDYERKEYKIVFHLHQANPGHQRQHVCSHIFTDDQGNPAPMTYHAPPGWEIDRDRNGGYLDESITQGKGSSVSITYDPTTKLLQIFGQACWDAGAENVEGDVAIAITVYLKSTEQKLIGRDPNQTLFITGRGVCCCPPKTPPLVRKPDSVVLEVPLSVPSQVPPGATASMPVQSANQLRAAVARQLFQSRNHPDRYALGTVGFAETVFVGRSVARLISTPGHPDNKPVLEIAGLPDSLRSKLGGQVANLFVARLLLMSVPEISDRFGLTSDEAVTLRRAALGLEGPAPSPADRWDPPSERRRFVPDVVGMPLRDARAALDRFGLAVNAVTYADDALSRDTILHQYPRANAPIAGVNSVDLVAATGATVRIPDVIGTALDDALAALRDAGLESDPSQVVTGASGAASGIVLDVAPGVGTAVTPHAAVVLEISGG